VPRDAREIVVFLASPSDVAEDREAVRRAARTVNDTVAKPFGLRLHVEGWETVQPGLGRPQALINPLVGDCDVFVGLLNRWWGTPTGAYTSGFEEEFSGILARQGEQPPPDVGLFFRQLSPDDIRDPGEELKKVLAFQSRMKDDHAALYKPYNDVADLEITAQAFFARLVARQAAATVQPPQGTGPTRAAESPDAAPPAVAEAGPHYIGPARTQLVAALTDWTDFVAGRDPAHNADSDRLLAWAVAVSADQELLPVHAANRLYLRRAALDLVRGELAMWLRTVCADMSQADAHGRGQVIPGLYFFPDHASRDADLVATAMARDDSTAQGALMLLRALATRPDSLWADPPPGSDANGPARHWAALLTSDRTRTAAAAYLVSAAVPADGPLLAQIAAVGGLPADAEAVLAAAAGEPRPAVDHLLAHPYSPPDWAVRTVEQALAGFETEILLDLVDGRHRQDQIRTAAFDLLAARPDTARQTLAGAYDAMLRRSETSRDHLIDTVRRGGTDDDRWLLRTAWDGTPKSERTGDADDRIAAATRTQDYLEQHAVPGVAGFHVFNALSHQQAAALADRARHVLASGAQEFLHDIPLLDDPETVKVVDFVAGRAREAALRILAALPPGDRRPGDLELIRAEVAEAHWVARTQALFALARHAEPQDIPALVAGAAVSVVRSEDARTLLDAACTVGGPDTALSLSRSDDPKHAAAGAAYLAAHPATTDDALNVLLHHQDAAVRRPAIDAYLARAEPERLRQLLDEYPREPGGYFYDVMAALDWHLYAQP